MNLYDDRHEAFAQPGCNVCVCGLPGDDDSAHRPMVHTPLDAPTTRERIQTAIWESRYGTAPLPPESPGADRYWLNVTTEAVVDALGMRGDPDPRHP